MSILFFLIFDTSSFIILADAAVEISLKTMINIFAALTRTVSNLVAKS